MFRQCSTDLYNIESDPQINDNSFIPVHPVVNFSTSTQGDLFVLCSDYTLFWDSEFMFVLPQLSATKSYSNNHVLNCLYPYRAMCKTARYEVHESNHLLYL